MTRPFARRVDSRLVLWVYLLMFGVAETLVTLYQVHFGVVLYAVSLLTLPIYAGAVRRTDERKLVIALTLVPTIRLLSLSLPLPDLPQLAWYPIISTQLLLLVWLMSRYLRIGRAAMGLHTKGLVLQMMLAGIGLPLGIIEYAVLQPNSLIPVFTWGAFALAALNLMLFTGLTEELIFRGLLQGLSVPILGRYALVFMSILFAILHIGYRSGGDVLFVFGVGLLFAYIAYWSESIVGVALAHGVTNITLFLIMPLMVEQYPHHLQTALPVAIWTTLIIASIAVSLLILRAGNRGKLRVEQPRITMVLGAPEASQRAQSMEEREERSHAGPLSTQA